MVAISSPTKQQSLNFIQQFMQYNAWIVWQSLCKHKNSKTWFSQYNIHCKSHWVEFDWLYIITAFVKIRNYGLGDLYALMCVKQIHLTITAWNSVILYAKIIISLFLSNNFPFVPLNSSLRHGLHVDNFGMCTNARPAIHLYFCFFTLVQCVVIESSEMEINWPRSWRN